MASPNPIRRSLTPQRVSSLGHGDKHGYTLATSTATLSATEELAYSYTLRAALLTHLLLPRSRRLQHIPAPAQPRPHTQRSSLSIPELIKDFSVIRDTKSTRFPSGFTNELDKRITGVLVGKERLPEYQDPLVKRTFAAFLNEFKNPTFRKSMEKDRRVEDLLLIFFSKATTELQKGKTQDDDNWKLMVDRHVALFVRLISSTLKGNDWARDRPELSSRLQTIEAKLLAHSQDLADDLQRNGGAGGSTVEVEIPTSYAVKDMSGVLRVGQVFQKTYDQLQADIDHNKDVWTVKAALADLKLYQMRLSVHSDDALGRDNFATSEAYDLWKKNETQNLSLQIVAIIRAYPDLTKSITEYPASANSDNTMPELSLRKSHSSADSAAYALDPSAYLAQLNLQGSAIDGADGQGQYTFIPPDARATYLCLISKVLRDDFLHAHITSVTHVLSKAAADTLSEAASRWRMPDSSRRVLMLEAMRAAYTAHEMSLDKLDNALTFAKSDSPVLNSNDWTITDQILLLRILQDLNTALHAEIQALLEQCFASKPPSIGPAMYILEEHIRADPAFHETQDDIDECTHVLSDVLRNSARQAYNDLVSRHVPENAEQWTFEVVLQLGRAVNNLGERIRKRYRKNPEILGVSPLAILTEATVPPFSKDAEHIVKRVIDVAADAGEELPITDGFELYKELIAMRSANQQASPAVSFDFDLENVLAPFVWRWVASLDTKVLDWTVEAFSQDTFETQAQLGDDTPTDQERHSVSAMDIFRIFTQCVDQLLSLEWGDDLQHAQFMTAASKAIGASVAKYCELVEQQFVKEMDQLTPEQEVAARQTLQEKWLQVAKEALATKDKIEPFQFSPASLVKLNDIEYTILRLDDIEKMMDVDVCAEKLRQHEQLKPKVRQVNKYVFTIKIIEAENLQPCDSNGLSDPYVVIGDEYQKRLAKTRIIYENLNPRWDETVDISTTGPLHIVATIWDWDSLGDHDCVGRTSLKLDPAHFSDYLPREFWLDLDTQGRLLLRISMEGERDDIQFHFGKAFRTLKRAERDMTRKITDKVHCLYTLISRIQLTFAALSLYTAESVTAYAPKHTRPRLDNLLCQGLCWRLCKQLLCQGASCTSACTEARCRKRAQTTLYIFRRQLCDHEADSDRCCDDLGHDKSLERSLVHGRVTTRATYLGQTVAATSIDAAGSRHCLQVATLPL